jgi:hypothetical protein
MLIFYPPLPQTKLRMSRNIFYSVKDSVVHVSGKTYECKETLKILGAKWCPKEQAWIFPGESSVDTVRTALESILAEAADAQRKIRRLQNAERKARKLWEASPEGNKARVVEALRTNRPKYHWICCEDCQVISWDRMTTYCIEHADGDNAFRVRGHIWTGD